MKQRLVEVGGISQNETSAIHLDWHNFRPLTASSMLLNICRLRAKHHVLVSRLSRVVPCCHSMLSDTRLIDANFLTYIRLWLLGLAVLIQWRQFWSEWWTVPFMRLGARLPCPKHPICSLATVWPWSVPVPLLLLHAQALRQRDRGNRFGSGRKPCPAWSVCPVHNGRLLNIRICATVGGWLSNKFGRANPVSQIEWRLGCHSIVHWPYHLFHMRMSQNEECGPGSLTRGYDSWAWFGVWFVGMLRGYDSQIVDLVFPYILRV